MFDARQHLEIADLFVADLDELAESIEHAAADFRRHTFGIVHIENGVV